MIRNMSRRKKPLVLEPTVVIIEPDEATIRRYAVQMWKDDISKKTKNALAHKRAKGEFTGGQAPYGFSNENGVLVRNEAEQECIRVVMTLRSEGLSLRSIAAELTARDILPRKGTIWYCTSIKRILDVYPAIP